jgi:hypothetical protein
MRTISNRNTISCMKIFEEAMADGYAKLTKIEGGYRDAGVMTEVFTMAAISRKCNDTATANRGSISFERTPGDLDKIETRIGSMYTQMTNNTYKGRSVRSNPVTRAILHSIQCMVDISDMIKYGDTNITAIIFTDVLSVTYAAVITLIFRCFCMHFDWDPNVTMYIIADSNTIKAMDVYVGSRYNVETIESVDVVMCTHRLLDRIADGYSYVVTENETVTNMILSRSMNRMSYMSTIVDANTYAKEKEIVEMYTKLEMTVEAMGLSAVKDNSVRVSSIFVTKDMTVKSIETVDENMSIIARMRWFNNMIRHMEIDSFCYDCWVSFKIASVIGRLIADPDFSRDIITDRRTYHNFITTVDLSRTAGSPRTDTRT